MKVIYYSFCGCYSSPICAYLHLKGNADIGEEEFFKIPFFLEVDYGDIRYMGKDDYENEVYVMGVKSFGENIKRTLKDLMRVFDIDEDVIFIDTSHYDIKFLILLMKLRNKKIFKKAVEKILYRYYIKKKRDMKRFVEKYKRIL
ncbi:DUF3189 family protein [Caldanaerobacter sp.]|uniref:DUF3189 family protein n=1 Tax=Caldanaerobacter sp. TaxID=2930036 RepID=UPI003C780CFF